ncbi:hypothetical protein [Acinetobacter sp. YH12100]|uniref:hypothetical protein n=1 Tax=Acinetobacter sp. YH12100 TaxID=2601089 RepID=UPI0015D323C1|nr:hypothetical protein [Acinetobacter sp. YH12100]
MKVYMRHFRALGYCRKEGVKPFFDARNWDWQDFIQNGLEAELLLHTRDPRAQAIVDLAREEYERQQEADNRA